MKDPLEAAHDRRADLDLREVVGEETPPDLTAQILEGRNRQESLSDGPTTVRTSRNGWGVAAAVLLGVIALVAVSLWEPGVDDATPAGAQDPKPSKGPAEDPFSGIDSPAELAELPATTRRIALTWMTDKELPLLNRFRELRELRIMRGTPTPELQAPGARLTDSGLEKLAGLTKLESLHLSFCPGVTGEGLGSLNRLPALRSLSLFGVEVSSAGMEAIGSLRNLESLNLTYFGLEEDTLAALADARSLGLRALYVRAGPVQQGRIEESLIKLLRRPDMRGLERLHLKELEFSKELFEAIDALELRELKGTGRAKGVDFARRYLDRHPQCDVEFVSSAAMATAEHEAPTRWIRWRFPAWTSVQNSRNLTVVPKDTERLLVYSMVDEDLPLLAKFEGLKSLAVWFGKPKKDDPREVSPVGAELFTSLVNPGQLEELFLTGCPDITGIGLSKLTNLQKLQVSRDVPLSIPGAAEIAQHGELRTLELSTKLTKEHLEVLGASKTLALEALKLFPADGSIRKSDEWVALFRSPCLQGLVELQLRRLDVDEDLSQAIAGLPLERLRLDNVGPGGKALVDLLRKRRPKCVVTLDGR